MLKYFQKLSKCFVFSVSCKEGRYMEKCFKINSYIIDFKKIGNNRVYVIYRKCTSL